MARDNRPDTNEAIGARLELLRRAFSLAQGRTRDMSQAEFARLCAMGSTAYNNFAAGHSRIGLDNAMRIRARIGVSLDFIYYDNRMGLPLAIAQAIDQLENPKLKQRA